MQLKGRPLGRFLKKKKWAWQICSPRYTSDKTINQKNEKEQKRKGCDIFYELAQRRDMSFKYTSVAKEERRVRFSLGFLKHNEMM